MHQQFGQKDNSVSGQMDNSSISYHSQFSYGSNDNWSYTTSSVTPMKQIE
ncbi:hypothetical protein GWI33_010709, partial [Rhynchophorus ferrugineus]